MKKDKMGVRAKTCQVRKMQINTDKPSWEKVGENCEKLLPLKKALWELQKILGKCVKICEVHNL